MIISRTTRALLVVFLLEAAILSAWCVGYHNSRCDAMAKEAGIADSQEEIGEAAAAEFRQAEYLATGRTALDRVYNTQKQNLRSLVERLGQEAFPSDWTCSVTIEEFTKLILKVHIPGDVDESEIDALVGGLKPLLEYGGDYITAIGVFDRQHVCRLFIEEAALNKVKRGEVLRVGDIQRAIERSTVLTKFNSIRIPYARRDGVHLWVDVVVHGDKGQDELTMLLDTGASVTMLPEEVITSTGSDDLKSATKSKFKTASGEITCPMVSRVLEIEGILSRQLVAVSAANSVPLLGMDFFDGRQFVFDSRDRAIYIWGDESR